MRRAPAGNFGRQKSLRNNRGARLRVARSRVARRCAALLGAAALLAAASASAIQDEIQVYTDDIDAPGEYALETHINTTPRGRRTPDYPGDQPPYHGLRLTPEFSRGLTPTLEAGLYLPTTTNSDGKSTLSGTKLRLKWLPLRGDGEKGGWYFGTNHELGWLGREFSESRREYELRVIGGYRARQWLIGANAILGWGLTPGYRGSPDTTLAFKAMRDVRQGFALGVEYYRDIGTLAQRLPAELQNRTLYLIADVERGDWGLDFGIGHGMTPATDNWTIKAIVSYSFR